MLDILLTVLTAIKTIGYYSIYLSYKTGQLIVFGIQSSVNFVWTLCGTLWYTLVILGEDFQVFLSDVSTKLGSVCISALHSVEQIAFGISEFISLLQNGILGTSNVILSVHNILIGIFAGILNCITSIFAGIKHVCILFGNGIWFAVTFIPLSIIYLCISATYCIGRFFEEILNVIHACFANATEVYNFITDVPVESSVGLFIGICLAYVTVKFQVIVYKIAFGMVNTVRESLKSKFNRQTIQDVDLSKNKNGTCVICFERNKCLLTMPCRHLCMCVECWEQLQMYQNIADSRSCPVCRTNVEYTIQVY